MPPIDTSIGLPCRLPNGFAARKHRSAKTGTRPETWTCDLWRLLPNTDAKASSSRYRQFVQRFGRAVYELDAVPVPTLQRSLRDAITGVIDVAAFNAQVEREKQEQGTLATFKKVAVGMLKAFDTGIGTRPDIDELATAGGPA